MTLLKERIAKLKSLPALPQTVVKLIRGLNDGGMGADEIEQIVKTDEAISVAVLKVANSALQGGGQRAFTLQESIARLGNRNLQKIAVSQQCNAILGKAGEGMGLERGQLWAASVGGGVAAEAIAKQTGLADPGLCFVAGLLRDIGKLAMEKLFPTDQLRSVFASGDLGGRNPLELERETFGIDHCELGAELAERWNLPDKVVQTIHWHHGRGPDAGDDPLFDVVHAADILAFWMGFGAGQDGARFELDARSKERTGLNRKSAEEYMGTVKTQIDKMLADFA